MAEPHDDLVRTASRLWAGVIDALRLRAELVALELSEERRRLEQLALSALITVLAVFMLVLALDILLLAVCWDTHRVAAAVASCVIWAALAAGAALFHHWRGRRRAPPFAGIRAVAADDERALRELL
jgi:uncharacterized membrane protein YqjE